MTVTLLTTPDAAPVLTTLPDTPADHNPALVYRLGNKERSLPVASGALDALQESSPGAGMRPAPSSCRSIGAV
jgi:hypothetical protein